MLDVGGPLVIDSSGWRLMPEHFAERHGLIVIIALGESIVAIGVGAEVVGLNAGVIVAAVLGTAVAAALWWLYFDVVALVAARRLENAAPGKEQNEIARDSFSYLHFAMVAGIVLLALGLKKTLEHTDEALKLVPATALLGGTALYLLAHVAFRWRNIHTLNRQRLVLAIALPCLIPIAHAVPSLAALGGLAAPARRPRRLRGDPLRRGARAPAPPAAARRDGLDGAAAGTDPRVEADDREVGDEAHRHDHHGGPDRDRLHHRDVEELVRRPRRCGQRRADDQPGRRHRAEEAPGTPRAAAGRRAPRRTPAA